MEKLSSLSFNGLAHLVSEHFQMPLGLLINAKMRLHSEARGILVLLALEELYLSPEFIGRMLKRDPSGLRKLALRIKRKASCSPPLNSEIELVRTSLQQLVASKTND